jgi:hypothetical protein
MTKNYINQLPKQVVVPNTTPLLTPLHVVSPLQVEKFILTVPIRIRVKLIKSITKYYHKAYLFSLFLKEELSILSLKQYKL